MVSIKIIESAALILDDDEPEQNDKKQNFQTF